MARPQARFVCQQCAAVYPKWTGRCDSCGAWNSLIEELPREELPGGIGKRKLDRRGGRSLGFVGLTGPSLLPPRRRTGIAELGHPGRRRSRNWQVDFAAPGGSCGRTVY
jgi:DNA repair protein RadA/Sms